MSNIRSPREVPFPCNPQSPLVALHPSDRDRVGRVSPGDSVRGTNDERHARQAMLMVIGVIGSLGHWGSLAIVASVRVVVLGIGYKTRIFYNGSKHLRAHTRLLSSPA